MKWLFILALALPFRTLAQGLLGAVAYEYLYAPQWDKALRSYNFSRPFMDKAQPLLLNGGSIAAVHIFQREQRYKYGIGLSYSHFRSRATNNGIKNTITADLLRMGFVVHYDHPPGEKEGAFFAELMIGPSASLLHRKVDGKILQLEDEPARAWGIGGELAVRAGYGFFRNKGLAMAPFAGIGYLPYLHDPDSEQLMNQTEGLVGRSWTAILSAQLGVMFRILPKEDHH